MDSIKILIAFASSFLNFTLGWVYFSLIRIFFSIDIIGYYGAILSFLSLFAFLTDLGFSTAHLKFYPQAKNKEEKQDCINSFLFFNLIQYSTYTIVIFFALSIYPIYYSFEIILLFFFGELIRIFVFNTIFFILLGEKQVTKRLVITVSAEIIKIIVTIILVLVYSSNIISLAFGILISRVVFLGLSLYLVKNIRIKKPKQKYLKLYLKFSLPFFISTALGMFALNIDVVLIETWCPIMDVANYFTAKEVYRIFNMLLRNISYILLPTFSLSVITQNREKIFLTIGRSNRIINLVFSILFILVFSLFPYLFVLIFGQEYKLSGLFLSLFTLDLLINSNDHINRIYLQSIEKIKFLMIIYILQYSSTFFLTILFINPSIFNFGAIGGALALLSGSLLTQTVFRPIMYKKFKLKFYWGFFRNIVLIFSIFYIHFIITELFIVSGILYFLLPILYTFVFLFANYMTGGLKTEDIRFFFKIINFKNITNTMYREFNNEDS